MTRTSPSRARRCTLALLLALGLLLPAACVRLPVSGPVVETRSEGNLNSEPGIYIDPKPPQPGDSAPDIVKGFLDAMTATPIQTTVAKQFLAPDAQASWNPELGTITYADASPPRGGSRVTVTLSGADRLDARGGWRGPLSRSEETLTFPMVLVDGELRIADAPDALIVPESWFEQRFRQVSLYFFDPTARILVPEPVFVPRGTQLATSLIKGLLRGPGRELDRVSRSFIPAGLTFGLSVPVSADGVADISLRGEAAQQTPQAIELMLAQFAWTLRQEPAIRALRLSIAGQLIQLPGGASEIGVNEGAEYDPTGDDASDQLFGLRDGKLVTGSSAALEEVLDGPLGVKRYGIASVAVNLRATTVAAVSGNGSAVLLAPVRGRDDVLEVLSGADNLLTPAWDYANRLWVVDRTPSGARVTFLEDEAARRVEVPGVSGRRVRSFLVSRDGSRFVAVVRTASGDKILVSRIRYDDQGRVLQVEPAERIAWQGSGRLDIRAVEWWTPTTVAVLHALTDELFQVRTIAVDGSPPGLSSLSTTLRGRIRSLAGSPVPGESLYAITRSSLIDLSNADRGNSELDPTVRALTYVG
ncbi:LpqB family beta-propeller domain-containing protein [Nocardioides sp.]|uniref:LpqB family beta-propeller domain-containing protein n=1 Tax=Nocardioides sp. TaxID=35761 RepID=UPI003565D73D